MVFKIQNILSGKFAPNSRHIPSTSANTQTGVQESFNTPENKPRNLQQQFAAAENIPRSPQEYFSGKEIRCCKPNKNFALTMLAVYQR